MLLSATAIPLLALAPARAAVTILRDLAGEGAGMNSLTRSGSILYGMTAGSGTIGAGTIFRLNTDGTGFTTLHSFDGVGGAFPVDHLTLSGSRFYGMTLKGGSSDRGAVFGMNTDGTGFSVLHSFTGGASGGSVPYGSLTISGTTLYGTTTGDIDLPAADSGTLFSINTDGTDYRLLHNFGVVNSGGPVGEPILSSDGSTLYGVTVYGGSLNAGSLYSIGTNGAGFTVLHDFMGSPNDGSNPFGALTLSSDGSILFGTAADGGSVGRGAIFRIATDGTGFGLLHSFAGGSGEGSVPSGSLTLSGSTLYGMTQGGGSSDLGTIYRVETDGTGFTLLESFGGGPADGALPVFSDLILSEDGLNLYGMSERGGTTNDGVIFSAAAVVPEPAGPALLVLGALAAAARCPRRGRAGR